jgi:hypothetical protein
MSGRAVLVAWLTLGATIASGRTTAQQPVQQQPPPFRSGASFVRVDVYPTANGKPVLDLKAEDFEVFEDNAPQSIQSFEHVVVQPGPQSMRTDPGSIGQSLDIAANPRNRVFVVFIDQKHVSMEGSWNVRQPLIRMLDQMLGPDDLVGVMTSDMAASDVTLGRKTEVLGDGLMRLWP